MYRYKSFDEWVQNYPYMKDSYECREAFDAGQRVYKDLFIWYFRKHIDDLIDTLSTTDEHGVTMLQTIDYLEPEMVRRLTKIINER